MTKAKFKVGSFVRHRSGGVYFITKNPDDGIVLERTLEPRYEYMPVEPNEQGIKGFVRCQSEMEDSRFEQIESTIQMRSAKLIATIRLDVGNDCSPVFAGASNPTSGFIEEQPPEGTDFCNSEVMKAFFRATFLDHPEWFDDNGNVKEAQPPDQPKTDKRRRRRGKRMSNMKRLTPEQIRQLVGPYGRARLPAFSAEERGRPPADHPLVQPHRGYPPSTSTGDARRGARRQRAW